MAEDQGKEPQTRGERLAAIAEEYTEEIREPDTREQLDGHRPANRFAAVTSEGSPESSYASNGNLIVARSSNALAEKLRQECGEGRLTHGRAWDLDAPWHTWGNLEVSYSVRVGEDATPPIHLVTVEGRQDGTYLFEDLLDAETFAEVARRGGRAVRLSEKSLHDHRAADRLIDAETGR